MKAILILTAIVVLAVPAIAAGPAASVKAQAPQLRAAQVQVTQADIRTIRESLDAISHELERVKNRATDFPPAAGGGGISGPLGRTCAEAREKMRWSDLPCAPDMPAK